MSRFFLLEGYERGWRVKYTRYRRVLLQNKNGFDDAKVSISFSPYRNDTGKLASLWAVTNNLEEGKVVRTKVDPSEMFLEQNSNANNKETFTFPNIKSGSIIEFAYTIYSGNIYSLFPWDFQEKYPTLRSMYSVVVPSVFNYAISKQGFLPIDRQTDSVKSTIQVGSFSVKTQVFTFRWEMKEIPAYEKEPFVNSMDNYVSGVRFQLSEITNLSTRRRESNIKNWETLNKELYSNSAFGGLMTTSKHWERRELRAVVPDSAGEMGKAKAIFAFVRDHFVTQGRGFIADDDLSLKDIYKARRGSVAEINLMLTALLREEGLAADAVILSMRDNGLLNPYYPMIENFNYVIARVRLGGKSYYLDATEPRMGFGKLPLDCYNGYARVITSSGEALNLDADSLQEARLTTVILMNSDSTDGFSGTYKSQEGYYRSKDIRDLVAAEGEDHYFEAVRKSYPFEVSMMDKRIDSLKNYDEPVTVRYSMSLSAGGVDHFYFNPILSVAVKENPFVSDERKYPIEMPYGQNDLYILTMDVPKGYEIEELPKPMRIRLNEDDGYYEYLYQADSQTIQLRSRLILKKASFRPEDYQSLRDFFTAVVKKQSEPFVFRKKGQK